ncbi:hypothetical protein FRACYDRAFT_233655 [Fragilariopsis cylindrus CCMP1102]|uniref:Uncharacterized protein n=1 Tax=Fragilariopsis cylindrus CCMP1102 TaxID=635003 RepID=A0A1E7FZB3_9STRA|nr:hypothetical protein FRACYDRAFT_233655 [Fragilariopsis cylindrus CCMP1102]|eukprot:OEU23486.1 hypothetical protein FRACYDRAFT_233655 [Fragilariopsis cylindrus CCMP1102]
MSQQKSLESWPMPNLLKDDTTSSSGSGEEILSKKQQVSSTSSTLPTARRRQTISDLKKKNIQKNGPNFVTRRRKSISSEIKISFKDTLLRRRRRSTSFPNTTMSSINQHAYLEILRDLSIEDEAEPPLTIATDIINVSLSNNNNNNNDIPTTVNDADNNYNDDGDVEPFTLTHEDDDSLYDDIADAISSL